MMHFSGVQASMSFLRATVVCALAVGAACQRPLSTSNTDAGALLRISDAGIPDRPDASLDVVQVCVPLAPVPASRLPRCTAGTQACVVACPSDNTGDACRNACWANDATPADHGLVCNQCIFTQVLSCMDAAGCHESVSAFMCCQAAGGQGCDAKANAMFTCGFVQDPTCLDVGGTRGGAPGRCYAVGVDVTDGGVTDAGTLDADRTDGGVVDGGP